MKTRELTINKIQPSGGSCVVYVMMRDQRAQDNHSLLAAQTTAIDAQLPLVVVFNLLGKTGHRTREQFDFMLKGLQEVASSLAEKNIPFVLTRGAAAENIPKLVKELNAHKVYFDFSPLRGPRAVQKKIAQQLDIACSVVDAHNIIPLWVLSDKEEFAAHTIRSKIHKNLETWTAEPGELAKHPYSFKQALDKPDWNAAFESIQKLEGTGTIPSFEPGEAAAHKTLQDFINKRLPNYAAERNVPTRDQQSNLSPYLHYGMISSLRITLEVMKKIYEPPLLFKKGKLASYEGEPTLSDSVNAFLEELIVRKELADNYCFYNEHYDTIKGARDWGLATVQDHEEDRREFDYSREEWEHAQTHDEAWNAAQQEMMKTGKMHGYMRMYWAKKILEWSASPAEAIQTAIYLNDKYSFDGGDPNGYTGIMWSIVGIHDRPWFEREVFGKIRYMNRGGLERRFDVDEYVRMWT